MTTRRTWLALSAAIRRVRSRFGYSPGAGEALDAVAVEIAEHCASVAPERLQFDRLRFYRDAGCDMRAVGRTEHDTDGSLS